jgi:hypothetical protein
MCCASRQSILACPFTVSLSLFLSVVCWSCLGRWRYMIRFKSGLNWCTIST